MSDARLCKEVAKLWVDGGGDADGFNWCICMIKAAIHDEIASRNGVNMMENGNRSISDDDA